MTRTKAAYVRKCLGRYALVLSSLIVTVPLYVYAQAPGSSRGLASGDGIHTIQGRVFFPAGDSVVGKTVKVSLESRANFGGFSTVVDPDGTFRFHSLQAGDYTVIVDAGKQYEIAREPANIDREASPGGRIINLAVQLKFKLDASNPAFAGVPQNALDFYQKGADAAQKGNSKGAAEFLGKAVTIYPNFPLALSELGVQYMKLGQMGKASETFEELLKLKPNDANAHLNLGIALYNQSTALLAEKKVDESIHAVGQAETQLRAALSLNSPGYSAHYYLGLSLIKLRKYDEAQKEFEVAIQTGGENLAQAHRYLGGLYQSAHRNKDAADELEKYLKLDPKAADAERIKGIIKDLRSKP